MPKTQEHPVGEPTPFNQIREALFDANELANRIEKLREKLIGAPPMTEGDASERPVGFFEGRNGRMNELAGRAELFLTSVHRAKDAIAAIEEALDARDPPKPGITAVGGIFSPSAEVSGRTIPRSA